MTNVRHIRWLNEELPKWVGAGLVPEESAARLREHYGPGRSSRPWAMLVCSLLGATLIGLGVILLLAYNWDDLSRPARAALSFAPLVVGQALAFWAVSTGRRSAAWREGTGIGVTLAIGAAIALVSQTYNLGGTFGRFMLVWSLLALPMAYLLEAEGPALLYLAGITVWVGDAQFHGGLTPLFWALLALSLPVVRREVRTGGRYAPRVVLLLWGMAACVCTATAFTLERALPGLWIPVYSGLVAALYLAGGFWTSGGATAWQRPLHTVGAAGVAVMAFLLTFEWPWREIGWNWYRHNQHIRGLALAGDYVLALALPALAVALAATAVRRRKTAYLTFGALPVVAVAGYALAASCRTPLAAGLLFNAYFAAIALDTLIDGVRSMRLGQTNAGMLMLAALILARFLNTDISILVRGFAFIGCGVAFLMVNLFLARRKGGRS